MSTSQKTTKKLKTGDQYKDDIFNKLNFPFKKGKTLLDVGCGSGSDAEIFIKHFKLDVWGMDVYEHSDIKSVQGLKFTKASIFKLPYETGQFDYVFMHDVLHHIDEKNQAFKKHVAGLKEAKRVLKPGGEIVIVEGNRFNPIFYPHMVKMCGHEHFAQSYFHKIINTAYSGDTIQFKYFESHLYPPRLLSLFKVYEQLMEKLSPKQFLSYNVAIIKK